MKEGQKSIYYLAGWLLLLLLLLLLKKFAEFVIAANLAFAELMLPLLPLLLLTIWLKESLLLSTLHCQQVVQLLLKLTVWLKLSVALTLNCHHQCCCCCCCCC